MDWPTKQPLDPQQASLEIVLEQIAARAGELDINPRFPSENFESLKTAGIPQLAADRERCSLGLEIKLIRALARADASTARILDGHLNGVERFALGTQDPLRTQELDGVRQGELLVGVWGADPAAEDGPPARIERSAGGSLVLKGVKTFCSGAGGVERAVVVARGEDDARRLAYVDVTATVRVDRRWYRASGLRASESHRVEFHDTTILAILGGNDELTREPWFSRDAVRTAATWAGIADCILAETLDVLGKTTPDDVRLHAVGKMRVARASIDRWLEYSIVHLQNVAAYKENGREFSAQDSLARTEQDPLQRKISRALTGECRVALADAARLIAAEAARTCGSRALVGGGTLDRARRDLDLFLLQHRLDPKLVELGAITLEQGLL